MTAPQCTEPAYWSDLTQTTLHAYDCPHQPMTRRPIGCRPNTPAEDAARDTGDYATFQYREEAKAAADAAMPRRKHNRPFPQYGGWLDLWIVCAPANLYMRNDGTMYDYVREVVVR